MTDTGSTAPDFRLPNREGESRTLSQYRGAPAVLVFFPFAFSPICTDELCHLQDHTDTFEEFGARVLCISTDSHYALDAFARQESYDFEMLSDHWPHGEVARAYGVFDEQEGCARRHTVTVDASGIVRDVSSADMTEAREWDRLRGVLENLPRP
ncbi:peroxiredoxin [Kocuria tytonicola]|uniref:redoxin domain-containing protein n=1 Tax=Kocuria tytonicola TaxID=2055946 RepID=UPI000EF8572B|nr:redoxin domain-containing protein [Kocuria tytonicola]RLZ04358.1 peroxiredoxin [Kocuria tytonicola]